MDTLPSAAEMSRMDAFNEGQIAGMRGLAAGLNPYTEISSPEYAEWERGRSAIVGARLAMALRAA